MTLLKKCDYPNDFFSNVVVLNALDYYTLGYYKLLYIQKFEVVLYIGELRGSLF